MPVPQKIKLKPPPGVLDALKKKRNKSIQLTFRVNQEELDIIDQNAKDFNFRFRAQYLRFVSLNGIQIMGNSSRSTPIVRVDRTPKGNKTSPEASKFKKVMEELKAFDKSILVKRFSDDDLGIKPIQ